MHCCCCAVTKLYLTLCDPMTSTCQASPCFTISQSLLRFMSTELVMLSNHLILCWPLLLLPSVFPSIRVFSNELALPIRWPKYWNFSFSISPSSEYSRLIYFRIDWFDLADQFGRLLLHILNLLLFSLSSWSLSSVQFSCSVVSDSLRPHEPQHARPPCPSPAPGVYPNPYPSSRWCHPTISSSVFPFSFCPQSFPSSGSFPMSQLFASSGQSIGVSASTSVLPMNTQDWSPLGWTGWISLQSKGLSRAFSNTKFKSINSSALSFLYSPTLTSIHDHWKNHSLD